MAEPDVELLRRVVSKIVTNMEALAGKHNMAVYCGLGLALDICHEAVVGAPATRLEVLDWARAFAKSDSEDEAEDEIEEVRR